MINFVSKIYKRYKERTMDNNTANTAMIKNVTNYLKSQYMLADKDWISGCVEFLLNDSGKNYTESEIQNLAREQWLLNDLKAICPGSLPAKLKNKGKTVLKGNYVLQINLAVDVGTSAYQQYLKLENVNMENVEATTNYKDRIANNRLTKLTLTDGVQEVIGIEYRSMRNFDCDIIPGSKMLLKGPVVCRNGTLLLTDSSVELLGGEVEDLVMDNSLPMILTTILKITNPDINPEIDNIANETIALNSRPYLETDNQPDRPVAIIRRIQMRNNEIMRNNDINDDDIDVDQLDAIEAEINNTNINSVNMNTININTSVTASNIDTSATASNINTSATASNKKPSKATKKKQSSATNKKTSFTNINPNGDKIDSWHVSISKRQADYEIRALKKPKTDNHSDYPDDEDMFCEDEDYLREMEQNIDKIENEIKYPINVSQEPYTYIKHINEMPDEEKLGEKFKIKAQISKLISKLIVSKDCWNLKCVLIDGTGSLEVEFNSDVLTKLVGITPNEMIEMKTEMVHNPELKERVIKALYKAKESLQLLYCIIEITMLLTPKITQLIPFEHSHEMQQKNRLENTGLEK